MRALEIQILSGVHAGVRYPVSKSGFRLASDEYADLALLDAAVEGLDFAFSRVDEATLSIMSRADYEVFDERRTPVRPKTRWALGQFLQIRDVWLALTAEGAPWLVIPAGERNELAAAFSVALKQPAAAGRLKLKPAPHAPVAPDAPADRAEARRARRVASIALASIVALVLLAGLGVALLAMQADGSLRQQVAVQAAVPKKAVVELSATSATLAPSAEELAAAKMKSAREALEKSIDQAGLAEDVSVKWETEGVVLDASINPRALPQLEQVLFDFDRDFGGAFKLDASVTPLWTLLPFRVREVVAGRNGWVVTEKGERILVGGELGGYRLVMLAADRLVFSGPKIVEFDL